MAILFKLALVLLGCMLVTALFIAFIAWGFDLQWRIRKRKRARKNYIRENADLVDRFLDKIRGEDKW